MKKEKFIPALGFHILTPFYDWGTERFGFGKPIRERVLQAVGLEGDERLLDMGCGTGSLLIELKKKYPRLTAVGLDPDPRILAIAEQKAKKIGLTINWSEGYAQHLPFPDRYFDVVVSTMMFHHLSSDVKRHAANEAHRVLIPGGRFLLVDFGKPVSFLAHTLLFVVSLVDGREEMEANLRGEIPSILRDAGFWEIEDAAERYHGVQFLRARK